MVKTSFTTIASLAAALSLVNAQTVTQAAGQAAGQAANTNDAALPTDVGALFSSLVANPSALKSYLSEASAQVSLLPTQYQASMYSELAEASKSLDAALAKQTTKSSSANTLSTSMALVAGALTVTGVLAALI